MLESLRDQLLQCWPMMKASPWVSVVLLVVGAIAGWLLNSLVAKLRIRSGAAKLDAEDHQQALFRSMLSDVASKYADISSRLSMVVAEITALDQQIQTGASRVVLTNISASANAHIINVDQANAALGSTLSALSRETATPGTGS
jgi:hypothetical protein